MPTDAVTLLAILSLLLWLGAFVEVAHGSRRLKRLAQLDAPPPAVWPRVSIVFAARNEAATVGAAVPTMLALDYPDLEVIAVDDRSDDETRTVLETLAARDPRLVVEHLPGLRPGWLGKNQALHRGAQRGTGRWILFTDADIHFAPGALRRAIAYAESAQLAHLAAVPHLGGHTHALGVCVGAFSINFMMFLRPWKVPDPRSVAHAGVGAFNLVRTALYRRAGGHEPIRLRPDDDIQLGRLMKRFGPSEFLFGAGALSVAWYPDVPAYIRGLEKNAFAGVGYRAWMVLGGVAAHALFFLGPLAALWLASGPAWWASLASVALMLGLAVDHTRFAGGRWWWGLFFPVGVAVLDYILLRSMVLTLLRRGIVWRGTHYPLRELRANRL